MHPSGMVATALWLAAWLRSAATVEEVVGVLTALAPDAAPVVRLGSGPARPLADLLPALPEAGSAWLLLPRPGRTLGWPRGVSGEPGPAVLVAAPQRADGGADPAGALARHSASGALARHSASGWSVDAVPAVPLTALSGMALAPRPAARALAHALADGAERIGRLGLDRPAGAAAPTAWARGLRRLPASTDPPLVELVRRIGDLRDQLDLARGEPGGAVTAAESAARDRELLAIIGEVEDVLVAAVAGTAVRAARGG